ncbi:hypothetical protein [Amycolatopsis sp. FDAARGOS 1241]|uniref:hypothetical protein n=1 Tax=Amycolatopsis sp. FDAARGOS 1241 TaxID=2778070 RepID=UPI00195065D3|nr:hypothetical protein [Amycolatopsis sp. FDAARGOS 1241]QRP43075.1 hypothetical protein I6J71_26995 [Amycolatopsis sp. FDAARGOS 1241]
MDSAEDHAAMAWLCATLPRLQVAARDDSLVLASIIDAERRVREGASAAQVCRDLGYEPSPQAVKSGGLPILTDFGLEPVHVQGSYQCPEKRCARRAQPDDRGREPRCELFDAPMILRAASR